MDSTTAASTSRKWEHHSDTTPLLLSPVFQRRSNDIPDFGGQYHVIQRLVSSAPTLLKWPDEDGVEDLTGGEWEVRIEEYRPSGTTTVGGAAGGFRRVAVRSGDGSVMHASFELPPSASSSSSSSSSRRRRTWIEEDGESADPVVCWASFHDRHHSQSSGQHGQKSKESRQSGASKQLCVLAAPSLLRIWDVCGGGGGGAGGEGHSVALPFEARAIYALDAGGLLIQRAATAEDEQLYDMFLAEQQQQREFRNKGDDVRMTMEEERERNEEEEADGDEEFVLSDPPQPVRLLGRTTSPSKLEGAAASSSPPEIPTLPHHTGDVAPPYGGIPPPPIPAVVPSLFTLGHPLDELRPVSLSTNRKDEGGTQHQSSKSNVIQPQQFADVHEKVLFVGTSRWWTLPCSANDGNEARKGRRTMECSQVLCVTYHTRLQRHAVWSLDTAPPPPPPPPLWQQTTTATTSSNLSVLPWAGNNTTFFGGNEVPGGASEPMQYVEQRGGNHDGDDMMMLSPHTHHPHHPGGGGVEVDAAANPSRPSSRDAALANALGVDGGLQQQAAAAVRLSSGGGNQQQPPPMRTPGMALETPGTAVAVGGGSGGGGGGPPANTDTKRSRMDEEEDVEPRTQQTTEHVQGAQSSSLYSPFAELHPSVSMDLLYVEDPSSDNPMSGGDGQDGRISLEAAQVFLATDVEGSGLLVLCLLCPRNAEEKDAEEEQKGDAEGRDRFVLRSFALRTPSSRNSSPSANIGGEGVTSMNIDGAASVESSPPREERITKLSPLVTVPCLSAQPIQSTPVPPLYGRPRRGGGSEALSAMMATDILVCSSAPTGAGHVCGALQRETVLGLYRANVRIVDCALPVPNGDSSADGNSSNPLTGDTPLGETGNDVAPNRFSCIVGLSNPVGGKVDMIICDEVGKEIGSHCFRTAACRASLSLIMSSSPVAEASLTAIECAFLDDGHRNSSSSLVVGEFLLKLRSDCVRLHQVLPTLKTSRGEEFWGLSDVGWSAVSTVLASLMECEMSGGRSSTEPIIREGESEAAVSSGVNVTGEDPSSSAWEELLQSEFHLNYSLDHGASLFLGFDDGVDHCDERPPSLDTTSEGGSVASLEGEQGESIVFRFYDRDVHNALLSISPSALELVTAASTTFRLTQPIFDSLHLLYEDAKLSKVSRCVSWLRPLGALLVRTSFRAGRDDETDVQKGGGRGGVGSRPPLIMYDFVDHYRRDLGSGWVDDVAAQQVDMGRYFPAAAEGRSCRREVMTLFDRPPCIFSWMDGSINGHMGRRAGDHASNTDQESSYYSHPTDHLNPTCTATQTIHRLFSILFANDDDRAHQFYPATEEAARARDRAIVLAMIGEGITDPATLHSKLPTGACLPLLEVLHRCRSDPPPASSNWPPEAYALIGRADLAEMEALQRRRETFLSKDRGIVSSGHRRSGGDTGAGLQSVQPVIDTNTLDRDRDGIGPVEITASMLFPDNRVREAGKLLRSSRPSYLRVPRAVEVSDHDYERLKQEKLLLLCRRVLSLPLGRGMLTSGNLVELPVVPAEPLPMPDMCLSGRVPPTNGTLALDVTNCPSDMNVWPEFHNGVAAGLRLPPATEDGQGGGIDKITRTWIVYNKPSAAPASQSQPNSSNNNPANGNSAAGNSASNQPNHSHGGLLLALGLRGHLSALAMTDIYEYLTQGAVTTTVGILLGAAANKRGTCDPSVSKMLCLHVPSLLPASFAAMDVASPAQAAAVSGIGLLYQGSCHRLMTEFLLNEMGKRPTNDQSTHDREGYTLSCGLALGMINLSRGERGDEEETAAEVDDGGSAGLADLHIEERLHRYVVGGLDDAELRRRREAQAERTSGGFASLGGANNAAGEPERCSRIYEGNSINTDVTAPGATLALGLMFLQSGNKSISSMLALPDTHFLLDYVRPDLLLLRVIARSLVLWNEVEPTSQWISDQIPIVVRRSFDQMGQIAERVAGDFAGLANFASMRMDGSLDPSTDEEEHEGPPNDVSGANDHAHASPGGAHREDATAPRDEPEVDRQAVRQVHAHIVAGACFGLGLRFAGTGNAEAAAAISERVLDFKKLRDENDPVSLARRPERPILEMCLASSTLALAMVMAGTGDLDTLRLFKALRWRCDEDVRYGSHMAYGAAIGLLFLGGGTCTLGRRPEDVAALLMSFFPRFPSTTSDNQYHLQALRHCYALAVKCRELQAVDIDTRERVYVPIEIDSNDSATEPVKLTAPCLLLNTSDDKGQTLRVASERYYPVTLDLKPPTAIRSRTTLFVKKKNGHLSYAQDPHAMRSLLVQTGGGSDVGISAHELIQSFTEDPRLLSYARYLCHTRSRPAGLSGKLVEAEPHPLNGMGFSMEEFCTDILHECLTQEKPEALPLYLSLRTCVSAIEKETWAARNIWDIRLLRTYYECGHRINGVREQSRLLGSDFVTLLCENVDRFFQSLGYDGTALVQYVESGGRWDELDDGMDLLGCFLVWYDVPCPESAVGADAVVLLKSTT